jgi:aminoglycoside N3'-acetyltransferase
MVRFRLVNRTQLDYTLSNFLDAHEVSIAYLYTDFRAFGQAIKDQGKTVFLSNFLDIFASHGTSVVVPTFTYTTSGKFDPKKNLTTLGALNRFVQLSSQSRTSFHPIFAFSSIGSVSDIVFNVGKSAFGRDSVFERLHGKGCFFFHIGRHLSEGSTLVHHVEQTCGAWYRQNVIFATEVEDDGESKGTEFTAFLRRRDVPGRDFATQFRKASDNLFELGIARELNSTQNFQNVTAVPFDDAFESLCQLFYADSSVFI